MEKIDDVYDSLLDIYSELEGIMGSVYEGLQTDPTNTDKAKFLQDLGSVALKIISSQQLLVESYCEEEFRDALLSNLDEKARVLENALAQDRKKIR